jgi:RNA polymerase sigma factor (sigma-70 family)
LGERVLRLLRADKERGWRAVEGFFRTDLLRLIQRRLPSGHYADARQDAYQAISLALVEGDCRRLNSYDGRGSFTAFVLRMADRILIDHLRSANTRRRQTEAFVQAVALDGEAIEASPEVRRLLADDEADLKKAADVLACAIPSLSTPEQLYVAILLAHAETPPAREIARLMQRPTEEIYKMKQRILKRLRDLIAEDAAVKTWRASV